MTDYIAASDFKAALPSEDWTEQYDPLIGNLVTRASRLFDEKTGYPENAFALTSDDATTMYFDGSGHTELDIYPMPIAPTSLSVAEGGVVDGHDGTGGTYTAWSDSDFMLAPYNAVQMKVPYEQIIIDPYNSGKSYFTKGRRTVKVVSEFGYSETVPEAVKEACLIMAIRSFRRIQQGYQDTGGIIELGKLTYTKGSDPRVDDIIKMYKRWSF